MDVESAIEELGRIFPFPGYTGPQRDAYLNLARTVSRYVGKGGKILDFASGPCDKTAVLQLLGYKCSACDDLQDDWHSLAGNRQKILDFAVSVGIDFRQQPDAPPFNHESFEMAMLLEVLEHLHESPRELINVVAQLVKPEGYLLVTVPNAVNLRKRIDVIRGKTNLPPFDNFYWYPGPWRGHVREYCRRDLLLLAEYSNLEPLELHGCDQMAYRVPSAFRKAYKYVTDIFDSLKDSWIMVLRKPKEWQPRHTLPEDELRQILQRSSNYRY